MTLLTGVVSNVTVHCYVLPAESASCFVDDLIGFSLWSINLVDHPNLVVDDLHEQYAVNECAGVYP